MRCHEQKVVERIYPHRRRRAFSIFLFPFSDSIEASRAQQQQQREQKVSLKLQTLNFCLSETLKPLRFVLINWRSKTLRIVFNGKHLKLDIFEKKLQR